MKSFKEYNLITEDTQSTLDKILAEINRHAKTNNPTHLAYDSSARSGKYIRVYHYRPEAGENSGMSAAFFVDRVTGDVWKSASWKAKSKTLWGNIVNGGQEFAKFWMSHYSFFYK